jgi:uncharacterized delta-60 repeat protein
MRFSLLLILGFLLTGSCFAQSGERPGLLERLRSQRQTVSEAPERALLKATDSAHPVAGGGHEPLLRQPGVSATGFPVSAQKANLLVTDGSLDQQFGENGWSVFHAGAAYDEPVDFVELADGRVIAFGTAWRGDQESYAVVRYNADGTPDETYNRKGRLAMVGFSAREGNVTYHPYDQPLGILPLPSGEFLLVGHSTMWYPVQTDSLMFYRMTADGTRDMTFGNNGRLAVATPASFYGAIGAGLLSDGRILITGDEYFLRLNADFSLDTSYGSGGMAGVASIDAWTDLVLPNGTVFLGGETMNYQPAIVKITPAGTPDTSFGTNGRVIITAPQFGEAEVNHIMMQPDGRLIVIVSGESAGQNEMFASVVVRLNANGTVDTSFGQNGYARVETPGHHVFVSARQAGGGRILLAGAHLADWQSSEEILLGMLTADGQWEASFGQGGTAISSPNPYGSVGYFAWQRADGQIRTLGTGIADAFDRDYYNTDFMLAGFSAQGAPDASFATGGYSLVGFGGGLDVAYGIARAPGGKILVTGHSGHELFVARLNADGSMDDSFGIGGRTTFGWEGAGRAVGTLSDGSIVVAGYQNFMGCFAYRFTASGEEIDDNAFYSSSILGGSASCFDLAVQPDGRIVITGERWSGSNWDGIVFRLNSDLTPDTGFGDGGYVLVDVEANDFLYGVDLHTDGRIVAAGTSSFSAGPNFLVVRLNADGSRDESFGTNGVVAVDLGGSERARGVGIAPNGQVLFAGNMFVGSAWTGAVGRLNADGSLDTGFGQDGVARIDVTEAGADWNEILFDVEVQHDGRALVVGNAYIPGQAHFLAVRLNTDGTLDNSFAGNGLALVSKESYSFDYGYAMAVTTGGDLLVAGTSSASWSYDASIARFHNSVPTTADEPVLTPFQLALTAYPNPTAGGATVRIEIPQSQDVHVAVYDVLGREVARLHSGLLAAGSHDLTLDTAPLANGVYFVNLRSANGVESRSLVVRK